MVLHTQEEPLVFTGMGAVTPLGNCVDEYWRNLIEGRSGIGCISRFDSSLLPVHLAAEVRYLRTGSGTVALHVERHSIRRSGRPDRIQDLFPSEGVFFPGHIGRSGPVLLGVVHYESLPLGRNEISGGGQFAIRHRHAGDVSSVGVYEQGVGRCPPATPIRVKSIT